MGYTNCSMYTMGCYSDRRRNTGCMDEPGKHYTKCKKPDPKVLTLCDSIYRKYPELVNP